MTGITTTSSLRERFDGGQTFADFAASVEKNADLWKGVYALVHMSDAIVARAAALGTWHLLVMAEDWCGDAVNTTPVLQRLTERATNLDLRIISRDGNPDLMDSHLTGTSRSIPVVLILDSNYEERAWWGPRPTELQAWVMKEGMALPKDERYKRIRTWYARDHGATTLDEVVSAIERVGPRP